MVLRGATSLRGALKGVGPENRDFFGPLEPQKVEILLCVVVCKSGVEVSLQLCFVRRYSGGGGWLAGLPLPLPL